MSDMDVWLPGLIEQVTAYLGCQPRIVVDKPTKVHTGAMRRCWAWFPTGGGRPVNHNLSVDEHPDHWLTTASNHLGTRTRLATAKPPTKDEVEAVLELTSLLLGSRDGADRYLSVNRSRRVQVERTYADHDAPFPEDES